MQNITDVDPETVSHTELIPFNATSREMAQALETLENIGDVDVRRYGPNKEGGFEYVAFPNTSLLRAHPKIRWQVTFDWGSDAPRGDIPLLEVSEVQGFVSKWTGGGSVVSVTTLRPGAARSVCQTRCDFVATGLRPGRLYYIRVRAHNADGWGPFTTLLQPAATKDFQVPPAPPAPVLSTASAEALTVRLMPLTAVGVLGGRQLKSGQPHEMMEHGIGLVFLEAEVSQAAANTPANFQALSWRRVGTVRQTGHDLDGVLLTARGLSADTVYVFR